MSDFPALSDHFNRFILTLGNQVLYCFEGSVLWLEASRSLREDTAGCLVSLTAISNANPVNLKNEIWRVFPLTDFNLLCSLLSCRAEYEQDVESGNTTHLGDCHGTNLISLPDHWFKDTHPHTTRLCTP